MPIIENNIEKYFNFIIIGFYNNNLKIMLCKCHFKNENVLIYKISIQLAEKIIIITCLLTLKALIWWEHNER